MSCTFLLGDGVQMDFKEVPDTCPVCMADEVTMVKFPAEGCTHLVCVACCRELLYRDETKYYIDPTVFGCPGCPNLHKNPLMGKQCECEGYEDVKDKWSRDSPDQYNEWQSAQSFVILDEMSKPSASGSRLCPFCKRKCDLFRGQKST